jgi:tetratricopeptide (TPR) repeat protein
MESIPVTHQAGGTGRTLAAGLVLVLGVGLGGCRIPAEHLCQKGIDAWRDGEVAEAERFFSRALEQESGHWKSLGYMGLIKLEQGRYLEAQFAIEKALTLRPESARAPELLDGLAEALYQQGKRNQLYTMLSKATEQYGEPQDYLRQARYLGLLGDVDAAELALRKAARFAPPDDPTVYLAMADFYEALGDREKAVLSLRYAYGIEPTEPVGDRLRRYGIVPGPTVALEPPPVQ